MVDKSGKIDISFLEVKVSPVPASSTAYFDISIIDTTTYVKNSTPVFCFGYSNRGNDPFKPDFYSGTVTGNLFPIMPCNMPLPNGTSGAPIIIKKNNAYKLIGISSKGVYAGTPETGMPISGFARHARILPAMIEKGRYK